MKRITEILILLFFISCAPPGTENDSIEYSKSSVDSMTDKIKDKYFIDKAFEIGALDKDSIGDYPKAIEYLDSAIMINPNNSKAYRLKAHIIQLQGDTTLALKTINKAILIDSTDHNSFITRAYIYLTLEQRDQALDDYYTALKLDSLDGKLLESIGYMEIDRGNKIKGCGFLRKARNIGYLPDNRYGDSLLCN